MQLSVQTSDAASEVSQEDQLRKVKIRSLFHSVYLAPPPSHLQEEDAEAKAKSSSVSVRMQKTRALC